MEDQKKTDDFHLRREASCLYVGSHFPPHDRSKFGVIGSSLRLCRASLGVRREEEISRGARLRVALPGRTSLHSALAGRQGAKLIRPPARTFATSPRTSHLPRNRRPLLRNHRRNRRPTQSLPLPENRPKGRQEGRPKGRRPTKSRPLRLVPFLRMSHEGAGR